MTARRARNGPNADRKAMERRPKPSDLERMRREHVALLGAIDRFESVACSRTAPFPAATVRGLLDSLAAGFAAHVEAEDALLAPLLATPGARGPVSVLELAQEHADLSAMMATLRETLALPASKDRDEQLRVQASDLVALLRSQIRKEETLVFAIAARRSTRTSSHESSKPRTPRGDRS